MEKDKLKYILQELYQFYPELKKQEDKLIKLISEMIENKPDIKFDSNFAFNLKQKLLQDKKIKNKNNIFNFNFMNKKILVAAGSLVVASLLFVAFISLYGPEKEKPSSWQIASLIGNKKDVYQDDKIKNLPEKSFGSLASLSSSDSSREEDLKGGVMGLGSAESAPAGLGDRSGGGNSEMMILPRHFGFRFEYKGEDISLENSEGDVYRRIKGEGSLAKDLAKTMTSFDIANIDVSTFDDLKVEQLTLAEDKDKGLIISLDLKQDSIHIFENWQRWMPVDSSVENNSISINDVPSDENIISIANNFLSSHRINLEHYGEPVLDSTWRDRYEQAENKKDFYIPQQLSVVYPLVLEDSLVRDQGGSYTGLRVNVSIVHDKVTTVNNIHPYRYEASSYELETDTETIISLAEDGGWRGTYYINSDEKEDLPVIQLGTPEKHYVQMYRYDNGESQELLVPSLIFPIVEKPDQPYYYSDYIVVPLVEELVEELLNQKNNWLLRQGGGDGPVILEGEEDKLEGDLPVRSGGIEDMPRIIDNPKGGESSGQEEELFQIMPIGEPELVE